MAKFKTAKKIYGEYKDKKEKVDKLLNPVPPQPNLVRIGTTDFYKTPPTPQEPNYDDPFADSPIGFDFDFVKDDCNIGIQITGILAFLKLPSFQFVWRNPECTQRKDPFELPKIEATNSTTDLYWEFKYYPYSIYCNEEIPFQYPELILNEYGYNFNARRGGGEDKEIYLVQILSVDGNVSRKYILNYGFVNRWSGKVVYKAKKIRKRINYSYEGLKFDFFGNGISWDRRNETVSIDESKEGIYQTEWTENTGWTQAIVLDGDDDISLKSINYFWSNMNFTPFEPIYPDELEDFLKNKEQTEKRKFSEIIYYDAHHYLPGWTREKAIKDGIKYRSLLDGTYYNNFPLGRKYTRKYSQSSFYVSDGINLSSESVSDWNIDFKCDIPLPPPPLPPMKKECCDEVLAMLALLLKRVGNLPAFVPDLYTSKSPQLIKKESLAELILWSAKQLDAVSGKYPLEVTIQDIDPDKKGNQTQKVELPNQAELLADIYQAVLLTKQINEALLPIALKTLVETGSIKLTAIATHDLAFGNADFLGWDIVHTKDKVKFSFNPTANPEDPMSKLLEQTEIEVKGYENKDKKDFRTWIVPIMRMASAWMAQNFRKVPDSNAIKSALGKTPEDIIAKAELDKSTEEDFDVFLNDVELGFITQSGVTDTLNPYGNPFDERPKIREVGGKDSVVD